MAAFELQDLDHLVTGYPKLGRQMGLMPETAIFRRFGALNAENLLYLQAELIHLEKKLREQQLADSRDGDEVKRKYAVNWYWLSESTDDGDGKQWDIVLKIRAKLREYNEALIQQSTIVRMEEPSAYDMNDIQHFLATSEMGPLALIGDDATVWGSTTNPKCHPPDLTALRARHDEDIFSKWVTEKAIMQFFRCKGHRFKKPSPVYGMVCYKDSTLLRLTYMITSLLASLLPIASITVLYYVESMRARLAVIAAFNLVICSCLTAFTTAKRTDVFAVAAA
ncbi:hypothetical protein H2201_004138 [Coniosporium apollinis]|uniref:DUF6594 domain-containing protein n=1 Tax=Coniosporium apollinis TaxID=61459 RepID=A0ABQ9NTB8_9PEZI|nr:hypothetical protein H2201_004138 [Coniosporium apollinis]